MSEHIDHLILFLILALLAEISGTVGGFGSSVFFVPIASLFLDFYSVLGITAILHVASNLSKILLFRKGFDKKIILQLGIPAVLFVLLGAFLSQYIHTKILQIVLASFLIAISIFLLILKNLKLKPTIVNSISGGAISGFLAGLIGTGGAIRGLLLAAFQLEKNIFITTSAIIDLGVDTTRGIVYFTNGYMHWHDMYLVPFLIVISFVGTYLGKLLLNKVPQEMFRKIVLVMVALVGVFTLLNELELFTIKIEL